MLFYFPENVKHTLLADLAKYNNMEKFQNFYQNHGLTRLEKSWFFDFFNFLILESKNAFFLSRVLSNRFLCLILPKIKRWKNFKFLTKTMEKLSRFYYFFNFLILESKTHSNTFCWLILPKIETWKKFQIFDQNHGLTSLEKYQIFNFFNFVISESKNAFFLSRISTKTFSWPI